MQCGNARQGALWHDRVCDAVGALPLFSCIRRIFHVAMAHFALVTYQANLDGEHCSTSAGVSMACQWRVIHQESVGMFCLISLVIMRVFMQQLAFLLGPPVIFVNTLANQVCSCQAYLKMHTYGTQLSLLIVSHVFTEPSLQRWWRRSCHRCIQNWQMLDDSSSKAVQPQYPQQRCPQEIVRKSAAQECGGIQRVCLFDVPVQSLIPSKEPIRGFWILTPASNGCHYTMSEKHIL